MQLPENFACKDKDVRRHWPKITMHINADKNARDAPTPSGHTDLNMPAT
jgi:hypothetical protein